MNLAFIRRQKDGSHLDAFRPQHQSRRQTSSVGDAARGDDWDVPRVHDLRHKRHGAELPDMAAGLSAFSHQRVGSRPFHPFG